MSDLGRIPAPKGASIPTEQAPPPVLDGVIYNAVVEPVPGWPDMLWARGDLHGDRKGRFRDGDRIHTSYIVTGPDADGIIRTRNSVYRLVSTAAPKAGAAGMEPQSGGMRP